MSFSNVKRVKTINRLKNVHFDVLIIGGGITGAGIALDAASRGMNVALVEMQDFAAGTSSRSTKLVHGGLRYLKQFEVKMVADVGKERGIVYENGPHVTTPQWMLLPLHIGGSLGKFTTSIGLWFYDYLAGVKASERRTMLSPEETIKKEPLIKKAGLKGAGHYVEYRTDDARLTIEVIKAAVALGATACNYTKVTNLFYEDEKVAGVIVKNILSGEEFKVHAKKVISAAGPWVDHIREMDHSKTGKFLQLSKGIHIVIDQKRFPLKQAVYFDTPDGRMVFAIPRDGKTYVGTTDTFYHDDPVSPKITPSDRAYLINVINYMFPSVKMTEKGIESSWAGVRPLIYEEGKDPSEISRKDEIWESPSGLITIAGGKLTGYRKMAEHIVDFVAEKFRLEEQKVFSPCKTLRMPISGGAVGGSQQFEAYILEQVAEGIDAGLTEKEAEHLAKMYGSNVPTVYKLLKEHRDDALQSRLPLVLFAKLIYAIHDEMIATPLDFFNRRTGALLFDIATVEKWKEPVTDYIAKVFHWTDDQKQQHLTELQTALTEAKHGSGSL